MSGLIQDQQNLLLFLKNMEDWVKENPDDCSTISDDMDLLMNNLNSEDFFGTEGQNDPRGDFRDGEWSIHSGDLQVKE